MQVKLKRPYKYLRRLTASPKARFLSVMGSIFCWNLMRAMGMFVKGRCDWPSNLAAVWHLVQRF